MANQFFMSVDPALLEQYTTRNTRCDGYRHRPLELIRCLDLFTRSLQALPPRELQMVFQVKVLNHDQHDLAHLYLVCQSNISYRIARAVDRIRLFHQLRELASETTLRRALINAGVGHQDTTHTLMMLKTCSQKFIPKHFPQAPGARQTFERIKRIVTDHQPTDLARRTEHEQLLKTMDLVQRSWNRLTELEPQTRFAWKRNRSKPDEPPPPRTVRKTPGNGRRRGGFKYVGVTRDTTSGRYRAHFYHDERRFYIGTYQDQHHAALAINIASELMTGSSKTPVNPIITENQPDEHDAGRIRTSVRNYLHRKNLFAHV